MPRKPPHPTTQRSLARRGLLETLPPSTLRVLKAVSECCARDGHGTTVRKVMRHLGQKSTNFVATQVARMRRLGLLAEAPRGSGGAIFPSCYFVPEVRP